MILKIILSIMYMGWTYMFYKSKPTNANILIYGLLWIPFSYVIFTNFNYSIALPIIAVNFLLHLKSLWDKREVTN
jgi:hypothetical protein